MRDFVGYFGCTAIFIVMMGVVFHALVWPAFKCRKKSVLEWAVIAVFGFGMLRSMAVTPGLDSDLPSSITPAKLLPENYRDYIGDGIGLPILMLDQEEHAIVADLSSLPTQQAYSQGHTPNSSLRCNYYEPIISGDSGDPCFLTYNNELVILHTFHFGGGGSGPFLTNYATEIQAAMDSLSTAKGRSNRQLSFIDFSNHNRIVREVK